MPAPERHPPQILPSWRFAPLDTVSLCCSFVKTYCFMTLRQGLPKSAIMSVFLCPHAAAY